MAKNTIVCHCVTCKNVPKPQPPLAKLPHLRWANGQSLAKLLLSLAAQAGGLEEF